MAGYLIAFRGAGPLLWSDWMGRLTSPGVDALARRAETLGYSSEVYDYGRAPYLKSRVEEQRNKGLLIVGLGFSAGVSALTYLQNEVAFDLVLCIAASNYCINYNIASTTKRSVLWYVPGSYWSGAGTMLGFTETVAVPNALHLFMPTDPHVVSGVESELRQLLVSPVS